MMIHKMLASFGQDIAGDDVTLIKIIRSRIENLTNENQRLRRISKATPHHVQEKTLIESCGHEEKIKEMNAIQNRVREEKTALMRNFEDSKRKLSIAVDHILVLVSITLFDNLETKTIEDKDSLLRAKVTEIMIPDPTSSVVMRENAIMKSRIEKLQYSMSPANESTAQLSLSKMDQITTENYELKGTHVDLRLSEARMETIEEKKASFDELKKVYKDAVKLNKTYEEMVQKDL